VVRIGAREGQYVSPKTELFFIVDLSDVWVYADVYDYELPWIAEKDEVAMTLASVPGKIFKGSVEYIYPYAEQKTRTTKVRMVFDNPELLLRPDMFADIVIASDRQEHAIVIPTEAVVRSGASPQVYIQRAEGKFEPRTVSLGIEANGQIAILEGLEAGEEVVTSAQFLVDSESKLKEATNKMLEIINSKRDKDSDGSGTTPKTMEMPKQDQTETSDTTHEAMKIPTQNQPDHTDMSNGKMELDEIDESNQEGMNHDD
jgi:Cu(I)/Ag(I) efflux system membrane fusion protein